jgi:putative membrane protein insertion efficiency factor
MTERLHRLARRVALAILRTPILAYRYMLSPLLPPACRFSPSCSAYALEALALHGPLKGSWLAVKRLARCHPIKWLGSGSGYDPVPHQAHKH